MEVEVFNHYLFYVYKGHLFDFEPPNEQPDGPDMLEACKAQLNHHLKLWILADRLDDLDLCNAAMNEIIGDLDYSCKFLAATTTLVWNADTERLALRRLILDYYVTSVQHSYVNYNLDEFDRGFLDDLLVHSLGTRDDGVTVDPLERCPCFYHEHETKLDVCDTVGGVGTHWPDEKGKCEFCGTSIRDL